MKLFYNPPSPYARKVVVVAHETGATETMQLVALDPWKDPPELIAVTPLVKVPALETDSGLVITESTAICSYLYRLRGQSVANDDPDCMARTGFAQGLIDAAFGIVIERRRPAEKQWSEWIDRQRRAVERVLPRCAVEKERFDLGDVTLACGLAYLDFRLPEIGWRDSHPALAGWLDHVSDRPSMQASDPSRP